MSRHTATKADGTEVTYGFDDALGYFYQEWPEGADAPSVDLDTVFTGLTHGPLLELLEATDAPHDHKISVAADLPV